ncbi:MAG: hypothetical protein HOC79_04455, partial [Euryarchaeota archaeon]|nr:hypothetical protein [Euryarchaeota archaeon]
MSHIEDVLKVIKARDPNQPEFFQAAEEVLESLGPVMEAHPEFVEAKLLERIVEPERLFQFRVPWTDDDGNNYADEIDYLLWMPLSEAWVNTSLDQAQGKV